MPKSRTRAGRGRGPVTVMKSDRRAALVTQRTMEITINTLDRLIAAATQPYDDGDLFAVTENHHQAREVVRFLVEYRIVDALASLAGGDMIVTTDEPASVAVEVVEPASVATAEKPYPYVWLAIRRRGLDYHEYDPAASLGWAGAPVRTMCARSTQSPTSVTLDREVAERFYERCRRCADAVAAADAPSGPVQTLPVREPGAQLAHLHGDQLGAAGDHGPDVAVATLTRIRAALGRPEIPPTTVMCSRCGKRCQTRKDGQPYRHLMPDNRTRCEGGGPSRFEGGS